MGRHLKENRPKELAPGITGYHSHGKLMALGYVDLVAGSNIPLHQHVQEQITCILKANRTC